MDKKMTRTFFPFHCDIVEDADAGIDSDATVKLATSTHQSPPLAPTPQRKDFLKQPNKKSEKCRPYTRSQQQDNETKFNMEERWRVHDNIIEKLRKQQIGKSTEQITAELKCPQLHMKELQRRKAEKLARKIMDPQRKTKVQDLRMALCRMERIVGKQQKLNCSCEIIKRQVELLQSTIAEVKRYSEIRGEIDEEINQLCGEINRLQQQ